MEASRRFIRTSVTLIPVRAIIQSCILHQRLTNEIQRAASVEVCASTEAARYPHLFGETLQLLSVDGLLFEQDPGKLFQRISVIFHFNEDLLVCVMAC
jgi:hypothetical protein